MLRTSALTLLFFSSIEQWTNKPLSDVIALKFSLWMRACFSALQASKTSLSLKNRHICFPFSRQVQVFHHPLKRQQDGVQTLTTKRTKLSAIYIF